MSNKQHASSTFLDFKPKQLLIGTFLLVCCTSYLFAQPQQTIVTYAGNTGKEVLYDIVALSDGTFLVAGSADNLDWVSVSKNKLNAQGISNPSPQNKIAFILQLSSDMKSILSCVYLDKGVADDIRHIKFTNAPGSTTGAIFISGNLSNGYFLGRLNNNFVNGIPTGFEHVNNFEARGYIKSNHPWDVTNDGKVFYARGGSHETNWASVHCLNTQGVPMVVPEWRTHWLKTGSEVYGTIADLGINVNDVSHSGIALKYQGRGDLRSWTQADYDAIESDGNGGTRKGKWPLDVLFNSPWNSNTKPTSGPGYTGYRPSSSSVYGMSAIVVDRRTNNLFLGMNFKSVLPGGNPDFEPAIIAMSSNGKLLWWSRLYHEISSTGSYINSSPDQYIDHLAIDYSKAASSSSLVVLARCHGNNVNNFWQGNKIASNSSASGFQNQWTGSIGDVHISYICKLKLTNGVLQNSTFVAEYQNDMKGTSGSHTDPNLDGWPSPNAGWPNLNTTRCSDLSVSADGSILIASKGRRTITTANAQQKMVKLSQGESCWNSYAREYKPDLTVPLYSSLIVGNWDKSTGTGGDNTDIYSVIKSGSSILAVGRHTANADGSAKGNPIPVSNVPSWGQNVPNSESIVLASLLVGAAAPTPTATNLAKNKPTTTDSQNSSTTGGEWAVDGDNSSNSSRWVSANTAWPHWIEVDLQGTYSITQLKFWTGHNGYKWPVGYKFQYWNGSSWVDIISATSNTTSSVDRTFNAVTTNKVRLYGVSGSDNYFRLFELEVYGVPDNNKSSYAEETEMILNESVAEASEKVYVYPNPATDALYLTGTVLKDSSVKVINSAGQSMIQKNNSSDNEHLDIYSLKQGIYIIQVIVNQNIEYRKFIKK